MKKIKPLDYKLLRQVVSATQLDFETTEILKPVNEFIGQERAVEALNFGIDIKSQGYNLFAMGPSGIGKYSLVKIILEAHASENPTPSDWCYIHNFEAPEKPIALELPAGLGVVFQQDMKILIENLLSDCLTVFESDEYCTGIKKINDYYNAKRKSISKKKSKTKEAKIPSLYKDRHQKEKELKIKLLSVLIEPNIKKLKKKFNKFPIIINYLDTISENLIENAEDFIKLDERTDLLFFSLENPSLTRYKINLIVDNSKLTGSPIIFEENPSYSNLISRVEHTSEMGTLTTNFTLIRPGAIHLANGGFLIIEARKLKKNLDAWEALKTALYSKKIKIDPTYHRSGSIKPVSLDPMVIPLDIKVILLGDRNSYYSLCQYDPDFTELFKVAVDFDEEIDRNQKNINLYARLIATIAKRENLKPFHVLAVAYVIDYCTRLADDISKLTTHISDIQDLIIESDYWSGYEGKKLIEQTHVKKAIQAKVHRHDRSKELYYQDITRDYIIIKTTGKSMGQVNCLSVRKVGNFSYGHPTRVTARVRAGKGKIIDIQREIKMAGPLHSKAVLIIANFLGSRFSQDHLFSLSASLSFEQIYCWTEGDSASVGELCALLSALSGVPIRQNLSVTGSIDQYGEVQSIGGVNEKIEGFFDVCKAKGLTGSQGVLIPAVNNQNLMLREDVVEAAKKKKFFIYPIATLEQAIAMLTGVEAGTRGKNGSYSKDSIYYKVEHQLKKFSLSRLVKKK